MLNLAMMSFAVDFIVESVLKDLKSSEKSVFDAKRLKELND